MAILTWEPEKRDELVKRRVEWRFPEGMKVIGEWVDITGGRDFTLVEVDDPKVILAATFAWDDLAKFECVPVMEAEEVMKLIPKG